MYFCFQREAEFMEDLINISKKSIEGVPTRFSRFLKNQIDTNQRLVGIKGARGTGKTTLLLQLLKELPPNKVLFASLDNLWFSNNTLVSLAERFARTGGKYLYLDEVHKYANWSQELKNIYDAYPELNVVFTSSSALDINKGKYDLSRRALIFELPGLSFREFLEMKYNIKTEPVTLEDILFDNHTVVTNILKQLKPYEFFAEYLSHGYYPYFAEGTAYYHQRLRETINLVIETDLPAIFHIEYNSILKIKKLLVLISEITPYIPNIKKLSIQVGTTRDSLLRFLQLLHNTHIVRWLSSDAFGINFLNKPEKLYLENTNIAYALNKSKVDEGTLRETFFLNQLSVNHGVSYPKKADFFVDNKFTFGIGGKNKGKKQIKGIDHSFVVKDDIEYGFGNIIPLWIFGFLY